MTNNEDIEELTKWLHNRWVSFGNVRVDEVATAIVESPWFAKKMED